MNNIDLNNELYIECSKETIDYTKVEELLNNGANPLGTKSNNENDIVYNKLIWNMNIYLYELTKIFIDHGMVIDSYNNESFGNNPLWCLGMYCNSYTINITKLLLDNSVDYKSIELLCEHLYSDYIISYLNYERKENETEEGNKAFRLAIKTILLCASYGYILSSSDYIKKLIQLEKNKKNNIDIFNDYNKYYMREKNNIIKFYDNKTNQLLWSISITN